MKARRAVLSILSAGLALVLVWNVAARGTETKPHLPANSKPVSASEDYQNQEKATNPSIHSGITLPASFIVFLPLVQNYRPPCTLAPTLISPTNGSAMDTLILRLAFMRGTYPVSYTEITITDNLAFVSPILYESSGGTIGPVYLTLFSNLKPLTTYYWRVRDVCGTVQSPYSSTFNFITGSRGIILPAPTLVSPADGTGGIGQQTTLRWNPVAGAVGYEAFICTGVSCTIYFTASTSQVAGNLDPNTNYQWYVYAYNNYAYGNKSAVRQFNTGTFAAVQRDVTGLQLDSPFTLYQTIDGSLFATSNRP